jgi:hypothetical protein
MRYALPLLSTLAITFAASSASAEIRDRPYDFTDTYYRTNGIDPAKLVFRRQAPSASAVIDMPFFSYQRNVRVIGTSAGYGASGDIRYFVTLAGYGPDAFTNDAAGRNARYLSEKYIEYVFPSKDADPVGLGNARQSVVLDTNHGYFSANPLGLWLHVWISYTPTAFNTSDGRKMLEDLKKKNGLAKDGTPIIKTKSEIDNLFSKGLITKKYRNDSLRYAVCPIIRDPRDGGIAPDAFLNLPKYADGSAVEPWFVQNFNSLQRTGNWYNP